MVRYCNICSVPLEEFDPHLTCKRCRQPNPSKFYCLDSNCKACLAVKSYKPLDYFLKQKSEEALIVDGQWSSSNSREDSPVRKLVTNGQVTNVGTNSPSSPVSVSMENRICSRILSSLLASFKDQTEMSIEGATSPHFRDSFKLPLPFASGSDSKKTSERLAPILKAYQDGSHKLSLSCGDLLCKHSILGDPTEDASFAKQCDIVFKDGLWKCDLTATNMPSFISNLFPDLNVSLKFHPKARQFQSTVFGVFDPKLPSGIISKDYCLLSLRGDLKRNFLLSRQTLRSLLFQYSLHETLLADERLPMAGELREILTIIKEQLEALLIMEANCFGVLVQKARKYMLSGAVCKLKGALDKLIYCPVHPTQFFGPFVFNLQKIVEQMGPEYCIMAKTIPALKLTRLPRTRQPFKLDSMKRDLDRFVKLNRTRPDDKLGLALFLLPTDIKLVLSNGGNPPQTMDYEQLFRILGSNLCTRESLVQRRIFHARAQAPNESVYAFANDLIRLVPKQLSLEGREVKLREQFLCGLYDQKVQENLCQQIYLTFSECIKFAEDNPTFGGPLSVKTPAADERKSAPQASSANRKRKHNASADEPLAKVARPSSRSSLSSSDERLGKEAASKAKSSHSSYTKLQEISNYLHLDRLDSYDVICPWTGIKLRSTGKA